MQVLQSGQQELFIDGGVDLNSIKKSKQIIPCIYCYSFFTERQLTQHYNGRCEFVSGNPSIPYDIKRSKDVLATYMDYLAQRTCSKQRQILDLSGGDELIKSFAQSLLNKSESKGESDTDNVHGIRDMVVSLTRLLKYLNKGRIGIPKGLDYYVCKAGFTKVLKTVRMLSVEADTRYFEQCLGHCLRIISHLKIRQGMKENNSLKILDGKAFANLIDVYWNNNSESAQPDCQNTGGVRSVENTQLNTKLINSGSTSRNTTETLSHVDNKLVISDKEKAKTYDSSIMRRNQSEKSLSHPTLVRKLTHEMGNVRHSSKVTNVYNHLQNPLPTATTIAGQHNDNINMHKPNIVTTNYIQNLDGGGIAPPQKVRKIEQIVCQNRKFSNRGLFPNVMNYQESQNVTHFKNAQKSFAPINRSTDDQRISCTQRTPVKIPVNFNNVHPKALEIRCITGTLHLDQNKNVIEEMAENIMTNVSRTQGKVLKLSADTKIIPQLVQALGRVTQSKPREPPDRLFTNNKLIGGKDGTKREEEGGSYQALGNERSETETLYLHQGKYIQVHKKAVQEKQHGKVFTNVSYYPTKRSYVGHKYAKAHGRPTEWRLDSTGKLSQVTKRIIQARENISKARQDAVRSQHSQPQGTITITNLKRVPQREENMLQSVTRGSQAKGRYFQDLARASYWVKNRNIAKVTHTSSTMDPYTELVPYSRGKINHQWKKGEKRMLGQGRNADGHLNVQGELARDTTKNTLHMYSVTRCPVPFSQIRKPNSVKSEDNITERYNLQRCPEKQEPTQFRDCTATAKANYIPVRGMVEPGCIPITQWKVDGDKITQAI